MQGTCGSPPSDSFFANMTGGPLLQLKVNMCLILAHADVFPGRHGSLWLDNLYLRATSARGEEGVQGKEMEMLVVAEHAQVWMSNVFMQGTGNDTSVAMHVSRSFHAEGALCSAVLCCQS